MTFPRLPAVALALGATLIAGLSARPLQLTPATRDITGVLIPSRTGPADNFDIVTAPGTRSEATTRLYFKGPLNQELLELVMKMDGFAVPAQPPRSTTYPDAPRVTVTGLTQLCEDPGGICFEVEGCEPAAAGRNPLPGLNPPPPPGPSIPEKVVCPRPPKEDQAKAFARAYKRILIQEIRAVRSFHTKSTLEFLEAGNILERAAAKTAVEAEKIY